jgi:DNA mismatch endonuclease, patch repair protein
VADFLTTKERSIRMSRIRGTNTRPELVFRSELHRRGLRYRIHATDLPGKPDLVFPKYRTAILVHGCFWHRHQGCNIATTPKSNTSFWVEKFERNVKRDAKVKRALRRLGWKVFVIWECQVASKSKAATLAERMIAKMGRRTN